jgi:RimJ/RimL family protein N-acetyltransferase
MTGSPPSAEDRPSGSATPAPMSAKGDFPGEDLLHTRRLRLRGFCARDLPDLLRLGQTPRVTGLLLDRPLSTLHDVWAFIDWINRFYVEHPGLGIWRAESAQNGFLGFFSLMPEHGTGGISLGARLLPSAWGRGYSLEGGAALCEHAFAALSLPQLIGQCDPGNRSVPPLLARLGFTPEGETMQAGRPALRFVLQAQDWNGIRRRDRGATNSAASRRDSR